MFLFSHLIWTPAASDELKRVFFSLAHSLFLSWISCKADEMLQRRQ
jgi:hypothetical protein